MQTNQLNNTPNKRGKRGLSPEYVAVVRLRLQEIESANNSVKLAGVRVFPNLFATVKSILSLESAPTNQPVPAAPVAEVEPAAPTSEQPVAGSEQQQRIDEARRNTAMQFDTLAKASDYELAA